MKHLTNRREISLRALVRIASRWSARCCVFTLPLMIIGCEFDDIDPDLTVDRCVFDSECQQGVCSIDTCVNGVCAHEPACPSYEECNLDGECEPKECEDDEDCDDGLFCNGAEFCGAGLPGLDAICEGGVDPCPDAICGEVVDDCTFEGACCDNGECRMAKESSCFRSLGEVYLGDGTTCEDDGAVCEPGACCGDGECEVTTAAYCEDVEEGLFIGYGTTCEDNGDACGQGACCVAGACQVVTPAYCEDVEEGLFIGYGTVCNGDEDPCDEGAGEFRIVSVDFPATISINQCVEPVIHWAGPQPVGIAGTLAAISCQGPETFECRSCQHPASAPDNPFKPGNFVVCCTDDPLAEQVAVEVIYRVSLSNTTGDTTNSVDFGFTCVPQE